MIFVYGANLNGQNNNGNKTFGLLTGGITFGSNKNNFTVSVGQGSYKNTNIIANPNSSLNNFGYSISGILELTDKLSLMTDNFFMNNYNEKYFSLSLRSAGKKSCFDFGLMGNTYTAVNYNFNGNTQYENFVPYPYLAYIHKIK
jgi:hypothetical protein